MKLFSIIIENMIDKEALELLDEASVKEMVVAIGPRQKLLKMLVKEKFLPGTSVTTVSAETPVAVAVRTEMSSTASSSNRNFASDSSKHKEINAKKLKADFSIRSILENSALGEEILFELDNGRLPRKQRLKMVQVLVAEMIERFGDRPRADVKVSMARAVVEEFPFLKDEEGQGFEAWYTPGMGIHSATGWLEEKLRNVRRRSTEGKKVGVSTSAPSSKLVKVGALPECIISDDEYMGMVEWLKHHIEPLSKVKQYMKKTSISRAAWIKENPQLSVCDILKEHPRLFDIPGMIEIDFEEIFGEVADNLFLKWTPSFAEKVIAYANSQANWHSYLHVDMQKVNTDEEKQNVAIVLLPAIFPTGRKGKKKSTIDDAIKVFVDVQPIGTNMPKYLEENSTDEPQVLVHGSVTSPQQVFVVSKGRALERSNLLTAIDTCFKMFYIMDIEYPWQCGITWEFFQKVIFGLEDRCKHKKLLRLLSPYGLH
ncbi:uncharacterized protein LOC114542716 [Dendronephthya gigantea]|uniref:uncharacterized protein LOC114542716 n=1 Tax=Dendronephthya gigantea TaxID=151771 RepID=UPI00106A2371|nr:uncharacterized protein LOC114542716 [Dendronephthya gigantea]